MKEFSELVEIMKRLRKECPWDSEQTHSSIRQYLLEESYEVLDALDRENYQDMREELGDLLIQVLFHSEMASEKQKFDIKDVINAISEKLIRRHPHIFGNTKVESTCEVLQNWEQIKLSEKKKSVLEGVPPELPGLLRATRLQEKASRVGFDWETPNEIFPKIQEELEEFRKAVNSNNPEEIEDELGDFLFSVVNYVRVLKINPEDALRGTINKFIKRFNFIEDTLKSEGKDIRNSSLEEMDKIWEQAKK